MGQDPYVTIYDEVEFEEWCEEAGFDGIQDFEETTGVVFEEIKGIPFVMIADRVYTDPQSGL